MVEIPAFGVEEWLNHWEKQAKYDISQSTIAALTIDELFKLTGDDETAFFANLNRKLENYGWIEGSPAFKQVVSELYQDIRTDHVLQTNGATGANLLALYALIQPGDHVIAEYPSYQQLYDIPRSLGAEVNFWQIHEEDNWYPDLADLKHLIRPNTKLICLNNANNPTGTVLDQAFLQEVVKLADQVGAYILVDEVYQPLDEGTPVVPIVNLYHRGISTNSLSKTYSLPGLRIGWVVTPDETLTNQFRKFRDYTMICGGVLNDALATYALQHRQVILKRNYELVRQNYRLYQAWLAKEDRVEIVMPQMVSTSFPKLKINEPTKDFCLRLLKEKGVLLVPGEAFDTPGNVRLGYCAPVKTLQTGLARLSEFLNDRK
ncbi:aminotransferase [Lactobacillus sp. 3B(2020)]|uniref:aminotransferase n=1 Tax=Lactobacillus sp. 3B(2020) TaxID=2695882 RepID=UPI0015DEEEF8|nr:aminotransferase [Lactobacillus sp. 3B(2020)]QLL69997.1 aminotransferase [Lactobacillus sp. 3B(2020)]